MVPNTFHILASHYPSNWGRRYREDGYYTMSRVRYFKQLEYYGHSQPNKSPLFPKLRTIYLYNTKPVLDYNKILKGEENEMKWKQKIIYQDATHYPTSLKDILLYIQKPYN